MLVLLDHSRPSHFIKQTQPSVLNWFCSYLTDQRFYVSMDTVKLDVGFPKGQLSGHNRGLSYRS